MQEKAGNLQGNAPPEHPKVEAEQHPNVLGRRRRVGRK